MKLSLATNYDNQLVDAIKELPIVELYGKLPADWVGGGRASFMLHALRKKSFVQHVRYAKARGIEFNYLLNAACLNNTEFTRRGQWAIRKLLDWLSEVGIDSVTVAVPPLLEMVKRRYPHLAARISLFAKIDNVQLVKRWEQLGADSITLDSLGVNRDFTMLKKIREATDLDLLLLANNSCQLFCPLGPYHMVSLAHASQSGHGKRGVLFDYCYFRCSMEKLLHPVNYLRADWIRPEDLHLYEALGYTHFKLTERDAPTDVLVTRARAYTERCYDGNLLDLIQPFAYRTDQHISRYEKIRRCLHFLRYGVRPLTISPRLTSKVYHLMKRRAMLHSLRQANPVVIDNRRLDGFLDFFQTHDCANSPCASCRYCHQWAERVVYIDEAYRTDCLSLYREIDQALYPKCYGGRQQ